MQKNIYICQNCAWEGSKWHGKCPQCSTWNSIAEEVKPILSPSKRPHFFISEKNKQPQTFSQIIKQDNKRYPSGLKEFDKVLGGGFVSGAFILLGGSPGVGKSTLLLQICGNVSQAKKVLYISAEESSSQSALRAKRLNINRPNLLFYNENSLEEILIQAEKIKPDLVILDSIQTVYLNSLSSAPGTVSQVKECAGLLMNFAKSSSTTVIVVGHVTKDGSLAGPRVLEHLVDTVLSIEGDSESQCRILRTNKNRFGPNNEIALFEMNEEGLEEITNPSEFFLSERLKDPIGSVIFPTIEGSRPLLCEIQALVTSSYLPMPRRACVGLDINRVHLVGAVLDKYLQVDLAKKDLAVNLVGGLKITEPASDLAIAIAILSSRFKNPIDSKSCFFAELGLTGELRSCRFALERVQEAEKLGFKQVYLPKSLESFFKKKTIKIKLNFKNHINEFKF
ncbi:MAG: DNA repair protein RadA [Bdellovibrionaceae bacterium]|nr:DNA repair protein RadA [Pseudobdellovibrionaceae bacterium]